MDTKYLTPLAIVLSAILISCTVVYVHYDGEEHQGMSPSDMVSASVKLKCMDGGKEVGEGTGFVTDRNGILVITNAHVISTEGVANDMVIAMFDGSEVEHELLLKVFDVNKDIAVLTFENTPENIRTVGFGNSDDLEYGQKLFVVGNPMYLGLAFTEGVVSQPYHETYFQGRNMTGILLNIGVNHGNSGGPLFNECGEVVGIITMKFWKVESGIEDLSFAIRSNDVVKYLDSVLE